MKYNSPDGATQLEIFRGMAVLKTAGAESRPLHAMQFSSHAWGQAC